MLIVSAKKTSISRTCVCFEREREREDGDRSNAYRILVNYFFENGYVEDREGGGKITLRRILVK